MGKQDASGRCIGFDLGGTKMAAYVFDPDFKILAKVKKKTEAQDGAAAGLDRVEGCIREALKEAGGDAGVSAIGIGCPGPLDLNRGVLLDLPNLGWSDVKLRATIEKRMDCPVAAINDVDAGVFGEYRFGAARGARCVLGVFPGTGIGGGCVYEGRLLRGASRSCMEIGHTQVLPDGPLCGCGRRGCLEAVASRLAIAAAAAQAAHRGEAPHLLEESGMSLKSIRSRALAESIEAGDKAVETIVRQAAAWIGLAIANAVNLLAPDVVLLGGGLVEALPKLFREEVERAARSRVMPAFEDAFEVRVAALGDDAVAYGAAAWARETARNA